MFDDFLALDGYATMPHLSSATTTAYNIEARLIDQQPTCTVCGSTLTLCGSYSRTFVDVPRGAMHVNVHVIVPRRYCPNCKLTRGDRLPNLNASHNATQRAVEYVYAQLTARKSLIWIERETGMSGRTVGRIAHEWQAAHEAARSMECAEYMGIDEIYIAGGLRCPITDIGSGRIMEFLPNNRMSTIITFLTSLKSPHKVKAFAMDLCAHYQQAIRMVFPHAVIVVDKAHVLLLARKRFNSIRSLIGRTFVDACLEGLTAQTGLPGDKQERASMLQKVRLDKRKVLHSMHRAADLFIAPTDKLSERQKAIVEGWLLKFPELRESYVYLQKIYEWYKGDYTSTSAKVAFDMLGTGHSSLTKGYWAPFMQTFERFEDEILAYFDTGLTNAYTEAANRQARDIATLGRGVTYQSLRAKLLYTHAPSTASVLPKRHKSRALTSPPPRNPESHRSNRRRKTQREPPQSEMFPFAAPKT